MDRGMEELFRRVSAPGPVPWPLMPLRAVARGASWLYGLGSGLVNQGYDLGLKSPQRLPVPVIGVGNISVGGSGKTPLVMEVVKSLQRLSLPAGVISRGYGGSASAAGALVSRGHGPILDAAQAGDEPVLMARRLGVPVAIGAERYQAGRLLLDRCGPRILVGDDLFQHRRLHRDLDLAVVDAAHPRAGGYLLPRGRLREAPAGLRRAQAVILTRADDADAAARARTWLRSFWGNGPVLACRHKIMGLMNLNGEYIPEDKWAGTPVLAFCGLARPGSFEQSLRGLGLGLDVMGAEAFSDHHRFTSSELAGLWDKAQPLGAEALVCSEKDAVRLPGEIPADANIWVTRLGLEFEESPQSLDRVLAWGLTGWRPGA